MDDEFVSLSDAARRLNTSRVTMGRIARRGDLETLKNPLDRRKTLVRLSDLETLRKPTPAQREEAAGVSAA